jgi:DeoR/GlpR family transcriptional regulator of sugar metabolism
MKVNLFVIVIKFCLKVHKDHRNRRFILVKVRNNWYIYRIIDSFCNVQFMNERQKEILQWVTSRGKASVAELAKSIGVSEVTVRSDLNLLEKQSYLKRVHGYAVILDNDNIDSRMLVNFSLKQQLAQHAASLVKDGETIFIEGGSTNALLARYLADNKRVTIITISNYIAHVLRDTDVDVILLGGMYQKRTETVVGPLTRQCIQQVHFNKAFIGIDGFTAETGFTGRDMMRADTLSAVLAKKVENIIVTDSSKFGQIHPHSLSPIQAINRVITDSRISNGYCQLIEQQGILVDRIDDASTKPSVLKKS